MKPQSLGVVPYRPNRRTCLKLPVRLDPGAKAAQISVLPEFAFTMPFRRERWPELESAAPQILVGYGFDLQRLADKVRNNELALTTVDRAIFALTDCGSNPLSLPFRENIWQAFGVPIYELIIAPGCTLLAAECELHQGWHLQEGSKAYLLRGELMYDTPLITGSHSGFTGGIDLTPCECGRSTVRLINLAPFLPRPYEQRIPAVA